MVVPWDISHAGVSGQNNNKIKHKIGTITVEPIAYRQGREAPEKH